MNVQHSTLKQQNLDVIFATVIIEIRAFISAGNPALMEPVLPRLWSVVMWFQIINLTFELEQFKPLEPLSIAFLAADFRRQSLNWPKQGDVNNPYVFSLGFFTIMAAKGLPLFSYVKSNFSTNLYRIYCNSSFSLSHRSHYSRTANIAEHS